MADKIVKIYGDARFLPRHDTLENWQTKNPILLEAEPSYVIDGEDGKKIKFGDGVTPWNDLPYFPSSVEVDQTYIPTSPNAQSGIATAEAVGVANDYTDKAIKSSKNYANNNFAPAIKNTVSDSVLAVHDVSPVEHDLSVTVLRKNLFDKNNANTLNGYFTANGNIIDTAATSTKSTYISCSSNVTYTVSKISSSRFAIGFTETEPTDGTVVYNVTFDNSGVTSLTGTAPNNAKYLIVWFYHSSYDTDITEAEILDTLQIELGSTATEYAPYVADLSAVEVSRYGKNLWDFYNLTGITDGYTVTKNGLTATIKDGYITIAGTHTYSGYTNIIDLGFKSPCVKFPSGTYSLPTTQGASKAQIFCSTSSGNRFNTFTMNALFVMYGFYVAYGGEGTIVNDKIPLTFISGPIRPTDYKPYIQPQTVTANADGTVEGLTSISPNMTIMSDTEGVVIDMTYNADTKMYIDNKLAEISTAIVNNV